MRAIIVAASPLKSFKKLYKPLPDDYLVAVDFGSDALSEYEIDLAIGDFDGCKTIPQAKKVLQYPPEKNEIDLELALKNLPSNVKEVLIYDALGGRLDHTLITVKLIAKYCWLDISVIDDYNQVRYYNQGEYLLAKECYQYLSLVAYKETTVTLKGVKYELTKVTISQTDTYTTSNEIIAEQAELIVHDQGVYVIWSK